VANYGPGRLEVGQYDAHPLGTAFTRAFPNVRSLDEWMRDANVTSLLEEDRRNERRVLKSIAVMAFGKIIVEDDLRDQLIERSGGGSSLSTEGRWLFRQFYVNGVGVKIRLPRLNPVQMFSFMLMEERFKFICKMANNAWRKVVRETRMSPHELGIEDRIASMRLNLHEGIFDYCESQVRPTAQMFSIFPKQTASRVDQAVSEGHQAMTDLRDVASSAKEAMQELSATATALKTQMPQVGEAAKAVTETTSTINSILGWLKDLAPVALGIAVVLIAMWNFYWPSLMSRVLLGVVTTMSFGLIGLKLWKQFPLVLKALRSKNEPTIEDDDKSSVYSVDFDRIQEQLPARLREAQESIMEGATKAKTQGGIQALEFASAIVAIIGVFGFVADTGSIVKKISGLAAAKKGIDVIVEVVLSIIVYIAPTLKRWTGVDLISKLYPDDGLKDFLSEAQEVLAKAKHGVLPVLDDQLQSLYRLILAGHDLALRLKKDSKEPLLAYLTPVMKELTKLHDTVKERLMSATKAPIVPVFAMFMGTKSGTGKSTAMNGLEEALSIKSCEDPSTGKTDLTKLESWKKSKKPYVHFTNGDKWDDGICNSTEIVRINEAFMKTTAPGMENSDAERIIKWVNPEELSVQFSSVEQKGTTGVRPKFILATTNISDFAQQKQIVNPQAVVRRIQDGIDEGTVIWFETLSEGSSKGFDPTRLNMTIAKKVEGEQSMSFQKGTEAITFAQIVENCCKAADKHRREGLQQAADFKIQAENIMASYYRARSLPEDTAALLDDAADEFDIKVQAVDDDPLKVTDQPFSLEDDGAEEGDIEGHTFTVTNMKLDDDRQGMRREMMFAFDECECGDGKEIIEYEVFRAGNFGSIDATSTLVRSFKMRQPVLLQVRGFSIRYRGPKVSIVETTSIKGSDVGDMPQSNEVGDESHFFTIGKYKFSLDRAYERKFFLREMFVHDLQFIGHAIAFQGMVGVAKAEVRVKVAEKMGLHSWYPSHRVISLFRKWGYKDDKIRLPFWSWRIQMTIEHPTWGGVSLGHDSFAFATWLLDSVLELAIDPLFVFNYLKKNCAEIANMTGKQIVAFVKGFDKKRLTAIQTAKEFPKKFWDALCGGVEYLKNKMYDAAQAVWRFFTDHAALIVTLISVIATGIGVFYGFSSSSEVTIQSGAGTRAYTRTVTRGHVASRNIRMKRAVVQIGDQKTTAIKDLVQANSYSVHVLGMDGLNYQKVGYATFVKGRKAIANAHVVKAMIKRREMLEQNSVTENVFKLQQGKTVVNFGPNDVTMALYGKSDLATIEFTNAKLIREHVDILKHFMISKKMNTYHHSGPKSMLVNADEAENSTTTIGGSSIEFDTRTGEKVWVDLFFGYDIKTKDGDCGSILISNDGTTGGQILGMHVAGDNKANGFAFRTSREDVRFAIDGIDIDDVEDLPEIEEYQKSEVKAQDGLPYDSSVHTGIVHTFNAPLRSGIHSKTKKVPFVGTTVEPKERTTALSNCAPKYYGNARQTYVETNAEIDGNLMYLIGQHLGALHRSHSKLGFDMLSLRSAIQGEVDSALKSIDSSTSAGYPWSAMKIGKDQFYFIDERGKVIPGPMFPLLLKRVSIIMSILLSGGEVDLLFTDNLKDERRKIEKVLAGKSRLVSASPLELTIVMRMLFGSYMESIQASPIKSGTAIGLNPYSLDWDSLAKQMKVKCGDEPRCGAGDYQGWDGHLNEAIGLALKGSTDKFYEGAPADECRARHTVLKMLFQSKHIRGGVIEQWATVVGGVLKGFGWPSGNALTAPGNSDMNLASFCYHYVQQHGGDVSKIPEFFKLVVLIVIGDDNTFAVSEGLEEMFIESNVAVTLSKMGMILTSDVKGEVNTKMRHLEEVSLIKRKFRYDEYVARWVAPLDLDVVIEQCMWTQNTSYLTTAIQNLNVTVRELSLHGRKVFDEWMPKLRAFYGKHFIVDSESWETVIQTTCNSTIFHM